MAPPASLLSRAATSRLVVVDAQTRLAAAIPEADRSRAFANTGLLLDAAGVLGVPMLAIRKSGDPNDPAEKYYPKTLSFPVTAFLRIIPARPNAQGYAERRCVLELYDPIDSTNTVVANRLVPLEADTSTALGYKLEKGRENKESLIATIGLLDPDRAEEVQGLYMVEPYDPNKIPVLMVHGLWSNPVTWMEMFNDLRSFPEIRDQYQFWFYMYPTGEPFWVSARHLREDLE